MSQHDMVIDNGPGAAVRADINAAIQALVSQNAGPVEPTAPWANMVWLDTGVTPVVLRQRNAANTGWITPSGQLPGGDVPTDGITYGRKDGAWFDLTASFSGKVNKAGDSMTGSLRVGVTPVEIPAAGSVSTIWLGATSYGHNAYINAAGTNWRATGAGFAGYMYINPSTGRLQMLTTNAALAKDALLTGLGEVFACDKNGNFTAVTLGVAGTSFGLQSSGTQHRVAYAPSAGFTYDVPTGNQYWLVNSQICMSWNYLGGPSINLILNGGGKGWQAGGGPWTDTSDARIKDVIGDYEPGLAEVIALQPKRYAFKGNDYSSDPNAEREEDAPAPASPHAGMEGREFIGLIAQEVEAVFPEMVTKRTGWIDDTQVDDLRTLDTGPLIYALVNAVKELSARIEALEAA